MKITVNQYANGLYELTTGKSKREINDVIANFIKTLQKNRQLKLAEEIIAKFNEIYNQENGIVEAEVVSHEVLCNSLLIKASNYISNKYKAKEVVLNNKVDSNIKGGIVIKVGDKILNGSVAKQISNLRNTLVE